VPLLLEIIGDLYELVTHMRDTRTAQAIAGFAHGSAELLEQEGGSGRGRWRQRLMQGSEVSLERLDWALQATILISSMLKRSLMPCRSDHTLN
jgi:hypothetical protein